MTSLGELHTGYGDQEVLVVTAKQVLAEILAQQLDDSSYEELVREVAFNAMVQQGINDIDNGGIISNEEMYEHIQSWRGGL